jgi:hypothetical protein
LRAHPKTVSSKNCVVITAQYYYEIDSTDVE